MATQDITREHYEGMAKGIYHDLEKTGRRVREWLESAAKSSVESMAHDPRRAIRLARMKLDTAEKHLDEHERLKFRADDIMGVIKACDTAAAEAKETK